MTPWHTEAGRYVTPADLVGPVISRPGPDCWHPLRLCMVADPAVCPHALTPVMGAQGYHLTRCIRGNDGREMTCEEVGDVLGISRQHVRELEARALAKLRRKPAMRRLVGE